MSRPWMPLYVADYLADTMHLSTVEHGAYMLLIMHYWQNGALPVEPVKLARIARMTAKEWAEISETIAELFEEGWTHKRIDAELAEARAKYERRAEAGRKGGQAKSNPTNAQANEKRGLSNAPSPAQAMLHEIGSNAQAYAGAARGNSQPQPQPEKKDNPESSQLVAPSRSAVMMPEWDDLKERCLAAIGATREDAGIAIAAITPMYDLLDAGWSWEKHILPKLQEMKAKGRRGSSWTYYANSIRGGLDAPAKAPPPPSETPQETFHQKRERIWSQQLAAARRLGAWSDHWGAPPGSPSCQIPPEFIAAWEAANPKSGAAA